MPDYNSYFFIKNEEEGDNDDNPLANNSRIATRGARSFRKSHTNAHSQESAISEQAAIHQHQTTKNRKRNHIESEDELAQSAKHPRTRIYSEIDIENWDSVIIEELCSIHPSAIRNLLNAGKSEKRQQRCKIEDLEAIIHQERATYQQKERSQDERYAALKKDFTALGAKMASILMANVKYFDSKVSDDTILGEWNQLGYNVRNIASNYTTTILQSETADNDMPLLRDTDTRTKLWEIITFHCFGGLTQYCKHDISQMLAHHIAWIDPCAPPSCQYLKMISNMKSAYDPNIKQHGNAVEDSKQHYVVKDAVDRLGKILHGEQSEMFKRDVGEIFNQAVRISVAMMRSKAIFVVKWPEGYNTKDACEYDPHTMTSSQDGIDATSSSYVVQKFESPTVWKIGNADGENFDSVMVLCKSVVVVEEKKAKGLWNF